MSQVPSMSPAVYTSDLETAFPPCYRSKTHPGSFLNVSCWAAKPTQLLQQGPGYHSSHLHALRAPPGPPAFLLLLQGKPESV